MQKRGFFSYKYESNLENEGIKITAAEEAVAMDFLSVKIAKDEYHKL